MTTIIVLAMVLLIAVAAVSLRTKENAAPQPPVEAFVNLIPTGDDKLDKLCADMWQKEDYRGVSDLILTQIAVTAREIAARYDGLCGERLLPVQDGHKYNDAIKLIFEKAGLTRPVAVLNPVTRQEEKRPLCDVASSHLARRTFIGNLYRQVKDPALVGSLSGHAEGSRAFARYRDIDDELRRQTVALLEKNENL